MFFYSIEDPLPKAKRIDHLFDRVLHTENQLRGERKKIVWKLGWFVLDLVGE